MVLNLNLGAGSNRRQDYISVDYYTNADVVHDLTQPLPYEDVDNIYACHVIEHFSYAEWQDIKEYWADALKVGGSLEIRCPDIILACEKFLSDPTDHFSMQILYGNQSTPGEYHKNGHTVQSLIKDFPGFKCEVLEPATDYELHLKLTKEQA